MYIAYNIYTKRVVGKPSKTPFTFLSKDVAVAECENIPQNYDYLIVDNLKQEERVVTEGKVEEVIEFNEETQQEEVRVVETAEVKEVYTTCDLIAKSYAYTAEQIEAQKRAKYKALSKKYIRKIVDEDEEFKILREKDVKPEQYNKYFNDIESCLARAHKETYGW